MKLPRQARAVIFDMDGLMFNTETLYRDAVVAAAAEAGHDLPLPFYLSTIGMSIEATRTTFGERYGKQFDFDGFWAAASTLYSGIVKLQLCLKTGVVELLDCHAPSLPPRDTRTCSVTSARKACATDSRRLSRAAIMPVANRIRSPF